MSETSSNKSFRAVVEALRAAESLLLVTHVSPDGDALGSMVGLARAGQRAGKSAYMIVPDEPPRRYEFLLGAQRTASVKEFALLADRSDTIVVVDTCSFSQLDELADGIKQRGEKVVVIDHHATCDDVGEVRWVDESAAAVGVMVCELLEALGWTVDLPAAEALATATGSDTGWFRFSNTDPRSLRVTADLLEAGVQMDELYRRIYQCDRPERIRLMVRMLQTLELHCDERVAVMTIRAADFARSGARPSETENLVNEALRVDRVEAAVLIVEQEDCIRASLRSRGEIDVAAIAQRFGGGGHVRAAGCRRKDNIDAFKRQLIDACAEALKG